METINKTLEVEDATIIQPDLTSRKKSIQQKLEGNQIADLNDELQKVHFFDPPHSIFEDGDGVRGRLFAPPQPGNPSLMPYPPPPPQVPQPVPLEMREFFGGPETFTGYSYSQPTNQRALFGSSDDPQEDYNHYQVYGGSHAGRIALGIGLGQYYGWVHRPIETVFKTYYSNTPFMYVVKGLGVSSLLDYLGSDTPFGNDYYVKIRPVIGNLKMPKVNLYNQGRPGFSWVTVEAYLYLKSFGLNGLQQKGVRIYSGVQGNPNLSYSEFTPEQVQNLEVMNRIKKGNRPYVSVELVLTATQYNYAHNGWDVGYGHAGIEFHGGNPRVLTDLFPVKLEDCQVSIDGITAKASNNPFYL